MKKKIPFMLALVLVFLLFAIPTHPTGEREEIRLELTIPKPVLKESANGIYYAIDSFRFTTRPNAPQLPARDYYLEIPEGAHEIKVDLVNSERTSLGVTKNMLVTRPPVLRTALDETGEDSGPVKMNIEDDFPENVFKFTGIKHPGKRRVAGITVFPMQYNPDTEELVFYKRLTIRLTYKMPGIQMIQEATGPLSPASASGLLDKPKYIIITNASLASSLQPLADWKTKRGVPVKVYNTTWINSTYSGYDLPERIRAFINDSFNNGTEWVLLAGDANAIPPRYVQRTWHAGDTNSVPTDYYYSNLKGTWDTDNDHSYGENESTDEIVDWTPDIYVGRLSTSDSAEMQNLVNNIINYEKTPNTTNQSWFIRAVLAAGDSNWNVSHKDDGLLKEYIKNDSLPSWFSYDRLYYLDNYTSEYFLDYTNFSNRNDLGQTVVNWAGHGSYTAAGCTSSGPIFVDRSTDPSDGDKRPLVYADSCNTGGFDYGSGDCLGEDVLKDWGIGFIGSTRTSYFNTQWSQPGDGFNHEHDYRFWEYFFNSSNRPGRALAESKEWYVLYSGWMNDEESKKNLVDYNLLGDPELPIWTAVPGNLTVGHAPVINAGPALVTINVKNGTANLPNATVCVWKGAEVYNYSMTDSTGNASFFVNASSEGNMSVTVTAHNFIPSESNVTVQIIPTITPESPLNQSYNSSYVHFNITVDVNLTSALFSVDGEANGTMGNDSWNHYYNVSYPALGEGQHNVTFWANDTTEDTNSTTVWFSVDTTVPEIYITSPQNGTTYATDEIGLDVSSNEQNLFWWYYLNGGSGTGFTPNTTINSSSGVVQGLNNLTVWANDSAGNANSSSVWFFLDSIKPTISVTSPGNASYSRTWVYGNVSVNENGSWCGYSLDGGSNVSMASVNETYFSANVSNLLDGLYNITFWCNDTAGNMNTSGYTYFTVDTIPPSITINKPVNDTTNDDTFNVTFGETVDWSAYELDSNGTNITMGSVSAFQTTLGGISDGSHNITVYANDSAGNLNSSTRYWTRDTTAPEITIISPLNQTYNTNITHFNVSLNKNGSWCGFYLDGAANTTMTKLNNTYFWDVNISMMEGSHDIVFSCNDTTGNMNSTSKTYFFINSTMIVNITSPDGESYERGQTINISTYIEDSEGNPIEDVTTGIYIKHNDCTYPTCWEQCTQTSEGVGWYNCSWSTSPSDSQGWYDVKIQAAKTGHKSSTTVKSKAYYLGNIPSLHNMSVNPESGEWWETYDFSLCISDKDNSYNNITLWVSKDNITWKKVVMHRQKVWWSPPPYCEPMSNFQDVTFTAEDEGVKYFKFTTIDEPSLFTNESEIKNFTLKISLPSITINKPVNDTTNDDTFNVTFGETVDWSAYELDSNGTNITMGSVSAFQTTLGGISDGSHNITVYANDSAGNLNSSTRYWTRDIEVPDIANVTNGTVVAIRAYIIWDTDEDSNSTVVYGTNQTDLGSISTNSTLTKNHNLTVQYITKNTTYYCNVTSCDAAGNCNSSGPFNFTTPECSPGWTDCTGWSKCSGGEQARTCNDVNRCEYPWWRTETQGCKMPSGGVSRASKPPENITIELELVPGTGLLNDTKLFEAVKMMLAKGEMSEKERESMLTISASISADLSVERNMFFSGTTTKLITKIKYTGQKRAKNLIVFEEVPKTFANNARYVTVMAPGATVEIVEEDPAWILLYPEVNPGDELSITYETSGRKGSTVPEQVESEVYAESLGEIEEPGGEVPVPVKICATGEKRCSGNETQECSGNGLEWTSVESCVHGCNTTTLQCNKAPPAEPGPQHDTAVFVLLAIMAAEVLLIIFGACYLLFLHLSEREEFAPEPVPKPPPEPVSGPAPEPAVKGVPSPVITGIKAGKAEGVTTKAKASDLLNPPADMIGRRVIMEGSLKFSDMTDKDFWYLFEDQSGTVVASSRKKIIDGKYKFQGTLKKTALGQFYVDVERLD